MTEKQQIEEIMTKNKRYLDCKYLDAGMDGMLCSKGWCTTCKEFHGEVCCYYTPKNKQCYIAETIVSTKPSKAQAKVDKAPSETVNHPKHYTDGKIEVIDFIEDKKLNYHRGNAIKYIARAGKKDPAKEIEDLQKAVWYLNREIERLKESK